ncbi:MAG: acetolactate synthase small subunit [Armatimonadota bacterium]|nr:MAG: acetolactate synthase small subunit [Armatimonadota bacterium]
MRHTISVLVENRPGVLARCAGLFARRGFNIESLAVSTTEDATISRMTIVVAGPEWVLEQIQKQLYKLMDVIKVLDHTGDAVVSRELALMKVKARPQDRAEIMQVASIFRANIVDVGDDTLTIEVTGDEEKISALENLLGRQRIVEMVRTGKVVLVRGAKPT